MSACELQGKSNNEISQILNRSPKTTSAQKKSVLQKLNVGSIAELISVSAINQRVNPL
ncbi:MAG: helix-turn-helix domain-containing protein [Ewingella sp.]|uniref:helix-turn-helix domain-containing protein n=1 Tax=Ewingella TaxID=41201 RepID=UPI0017A78A2B|nr:helix-turn-helix transcriptional regulator [Pseudomonas reactans]